MVTLRSVLEGSLITELRLPEIITAASGTSIAEVADLMISRRFGAIPIVDDGRLIGIFTERDWLTRVLAARLTLDRPVDEVMTRDPVTLEPRAEIWRAAELMSSRGIRHLPIVSNDGRPQAMISIRDVLGYLAECFPEQFLAHPPDSDTLTLQPESG